MKKQFLKTVSVLLCFVFIFLSAVAVSAENTPVTFVLTPTVYSTERETYVEQDTFKSEEIFYLRLTTTKISNLGGFAFDVSFDTEALAFLEGKTVCSIENSDGNTNFRLDKENNLLRVVYTNGDYKNENSLVGAVYYLAFSVNPFTENAEVPISVTVKELYDNSFAQTDIECNKSFNTSIKLTADTISAEVIELLRKLENIKYPDSKEDIDAALKAFSELSAAQKKVLLSKYPNEYEWLNSAYTRYNALAEQASKDKILSEVNTFKTEYADVLKLTVEKVALEDEKRVTQALKSFENCSQTGKSFLVNEGKLITSLSERIAELHDIKTEIEDFLNNEVLKEIWNPQILEFDFKSTYDEYLPAIELALLSYDLLSDEAKERLRSEYEWVSKLNEEAQKYLALDKAAALLAEQSAQFQKSYLAVFLLNQNNVTKSDRTAIEMVIEAYNSLENEELKGILSPRIKNLKKLLEILDELGESVPEKETVYIEVPGETVTVIEKVEVPGETVTVTEKVEVPGETVTVTEKVEVPGETVTVIEKVEVPGETVTVTEKVEVPGQTQYETKYVTNTNKVIQTIMQKAKLSNIILVLFVLLSISSVILGITYFVCDKYKKKIGILDEQEADS